MVLQPFDDGGAYDELCDEVIYPAIRDAGCEPYRVDRDPLAHQPKQAVRKAMEDAVACLADITEDNPNVFYEVGVAERAEIPLVLLCRRNARRKLPFNVQELNVIHYSVDGPRGFNQLRQKIIARLEAIIADLQADESDNDEDADPDPGFDAEDFEDEDPELVDEDGDEYRGR